MTNHASRATGGLRLAGIIILIAGALDVVWGIAALSNTDNFHEGDLLFESLKTWGWFYLLLGAGQIVIGMLVLSRSGIGIALGMFGAFLAILVNFVSIGAYPIWSCILIALNFVVLFLLATDES